MPPLQCCRKVGDDHTRPWFGRFPPELVRGSPLPNAPNLVLDAQIGFGVRYWLAKAVQQAQSVLLGVAPDRSKSARNLKNRGTAVWINNRRYPGYVRNPDRTNLAEMYVLHRLRFPLLPGAAAVLSAHAQGELL